MAPLRTRSANVGRPQHGCAVRLAGARGLRCTPHITQTANAISAELMSVTDHSNESRPKKRVISMVLFPVSASFHRALNCFVTPRAERFEETIRRPVWFALSRAAELFIDSVHTLTKTMAA